MIMFWNRLRIIMGYNIYNIWVHSEYSLKSITVQDLGTSGKTRLFQFFAHEFSGELKWDSCIIPCCIKLRFSSENRASLKVQVEEPLPFATKYRKWYYNIYQNVANKIYHKNERIRPDARGPSIAFLREIMRAFFALRFCFLGIAWFGADTSSIWLGSIRCATAIARWYVVHVVSVHQIYIQKV